VSSSFSVGDSWSLARARPSRHPHSHGEGAKASRPAGRIGRKSAARTGGEPAEIQGGSRGAAGLEQAACVWLRAAGSRCQAPATATLPPPVPPPPPPAGLRLLYLFFPAFFYILGSTALLITTILLVVSLFFLDQVPVGRHPKRLTRTCTAFIDTGGYSTGQEGSVPPSPAAAHRRRSTSRATLAWSLPVPVPEAEAETAPAPEHAALGAADTALGDTRPEPPV
jgi:hypothetical protein